MITSKNSSPRFKQLDTKYPLATPWLHIFVAGLANVFIAALNTAISITYKSVQVTVYFIGACVGVISGVFVLLRSSHPSFEEDAPRDQKSGPTRVSQSPIISPGTPHAFGETYMGQEEEQYLTEIIEADNTPGGIEDRVSATIQMAKETPGKTSALLKAHEAITEEDYLRKGPEVELHNLTDEEPCMPSPPTQPETVASSLGTDQDKAEEEPKEFEPPPHPKFSAVAALEHPIVPEKLLDLDTKQDSTLPASSKRKRGALRGPLHKLSKEMRKFFTP